MGTNIDGKLDTIINQMNSISHKINWRLILKITFGAAANNGANTYTNDANASSSPVGWYSSLQTTITSVNNRITITGKCNAAGRFGNQNNVQGYVSNIELVSFEFI